MSKKSESANIIGPGKNDLILAELHLPVEKVKEMGGLRETACDLAKKIGGPKVRIYMTKKYYMAHCYIYEPAN